MPRAVQVAQACVSVLAIWLIAGLASRAGGPRAGSIAAWMAALHPVLIWLPAYALTECVYSTVVLAAVWWLGVRTDRPEPEPAAPGCAAALAGAVSGAALLIRSATLVFAALAVAWLLRRRRRGTPSRLPYAPRRSWRRGPSGTRSRTRGPCWWPPKAA